MIDAKIVKDSYGDALIITRNGVEILRIEEFQDESHKGDHLFFIPLNNASICESEEYMPWTHELLRLWKGRTK